MVEDLRLAQRQISHVREREQAPQAHRPRNVEVFLDVKCNRARLFSCVLLIETIVGLLVKRTTGANHIHVRLAPRAHYCGTAAFGLGGYAASVIVPRRRSNASFSARSSFLSGGT